MRWRRIFDLFKDTAMEWQKDKATRLAAALSYYTVFSLAPLVVIILAIIKLVLEGNAAETIFLEQIKGLVGSQGAEFFQQIINREDDTSSNLLASLIGVVTLLFGATGVFGQLKESLNTVWGVAPDPGRGIVNFVKTRFLSFTMILGVGFLLLVSLLLSSGLTAVSNFAGGLLGDRALVAQIVTTLFSFGVITLLFAMIFKILPDAEIEYRDVWVGAAFTAFLFTIGKYLIGLYLGNAGVTSSYGAAGSLIVILLWVYYSAQILLFGAEFTQVYAQRFGSRIEASEGAHLVDKTLAQSEGDPMDDEDVASGKQETDAEGGAKPTSGPVIITHQKRDRS